MLTNAQLIVLRDAINADPIMSAYPNTQDGAFDLAIYLDAPHAPDYWVWRTRVDKKEFTNDESTDADGVAKRSFIWVGNGFITRSAGEQAAWVQLFNSTLTVDASRPNVRQAFVDIFSGTGNAASNRQHLQNIARRLATRAEKLFASGTGSAASPATMSVEGRLTYQDVHAARNLA